MRVGNRSRREVGIAHARNAKIAVARLRANLVPGGREDGAASTVPSHYAGVGEELSRVRRERDIDLETVARELHIQIHYLTAIEEGRFDQLPGDAYARGFLRAYADYLDLDSDQLLASFGRDAAAPPSPRPRAVNLPRADEDWRRPSTLLIAVSLLAAMIAVGVWQFSADPEAPPAEIPPPPDHLSALLTPAPEATPPPPGPAETSTPVPRPPGAEGASPPAAPPSAPAPASAEVVAREAARDAALLTGAPPPATPPPATTETATTETATPPPAPGVPPIPKPRPDIATLLTHAPATPSADVPAPPPLVEATAGRFGVAPEEARVVLRARADSWVQIQDGAGKLLMTRILKSGERYHAPDVAGLVLTTGNIGGLEIIVDGHPLGPIGGAGDVRRNLPLDAESLQALAASGG